MLQHTRNFISFLDRYFNRLHHYPDLTFFPLLSICSRTAMAPPTGRKREAEHLSDSTVEVKKSKSNGSITSFFGIPKPKNILRKGLDHSFGAPPSNFNKAKWVAS